MLWKILQNITFSMGKAIKSQMSFHVAKKMSMVTVVLRGGPGCLEEFLCHVHCSRTTENSLYG